MDEEQEDSAADVFDAVMDGGGHGVWWGCDRRGQIALFPGNEAPRAAFADKDSYIRIACFFEEVPSGHQSGFVWKADFPKEAHEARSWLESFAARGLYVYEHLSSSSLGDSLDYDELIISPTVPLLVKNCPAHIQTILEATRLDKVEFGVNEKIRVYIHLPCY